MASPCKDILIEPLAGGLDLKSQSGSVAFGNWRLVLNMDGSKTESWCRLNGWKRYGWDQECVNNLDLHDQMVDGSGFYSAPYDYTTPERRITIGKVWSQWNGSSGYGELLDVVKTVPESTDEYCTPTTYYLGGQCRETPTLLASVSSTSGKRRLVAATKSRIYANDDSGGNWTIIADGLGGIPIAGDCDCATRRTQMAQIGNTVLFSNGIDPVMGWEIGLGATGCYYWTADFLTELQAIGISYANTIAAWNGFVFVGNVMDSGTLRSSRLYWSDYNDPYSWIPSADSLSGFHDFGLGEQIRSMKPIGGRLRIYTDKAIYDLTPSSDTTLVHNIQEVYRGTSIPKFPYAIVDTGTAHVWLGEDDVWLMGEYDRSPQRLEWIRQAGAAIYKGVSSEYLTDLPAGILDSYGPINKTKCNLASGWWNPIDQSIWFSWPTGDGECPDLTLVLWTNSQKSTLIDHGFTGATIHRPDTSPSMRDWLGSNGLCDPETIREAKEGTPCPIEFVEGSFSGLFNANETVAAGVAGDSFFGQFCNTTVADLCVACDTGERWLLVSAEDKAIKEFTTEAYSRDQLTAVEDSTFPNVGAATYEQQGYASLMQSDATNFRTQTEKMVQAVAVEFTAEDQTTAGQLYCAVGTGSQPKCLDWETSDPVDLDCLDVDSTAGTRPMEIPRFAFWSEGVNLALRIWTTGAGNAFCMNSITLKGQGISKCW